ncbi:MAG: hypothetical protein H0V89_02520 [Deltaproteobacteria bacterium]|nr:hypothetical protein [Deltaproteobacteria bacterium]
MRVRSAAARVAPLGMAGLVVASGCRGSCPDRCPELAEKVGECSEWSETPWESAEAFAAWCPAWRLEIREVAKGPEQASCDVRFDDVLTADCGTVEDWGWTAADPP